MVTTRTNTCRTTMARNGGPEHRSSRKTGERGTEGWSGPARSRPDAQCFWHPRVHRRTIIWPPPVPRPRVYIIPLSRSTGPDKTCHFVGVRMYVRVRRRGMAEIRSGIRPLSREVGGSGDRTAPEPRHRGPPRDFSFHDF